MSYLKYMTKKVYQEIKHNFSLKFYREFTDCLKTFVNSK